MQKDYLTLTETAELLNISISTVRRMFDAGMLTGFRLPGGEHRRISRASIEAFRQAQAQPQQQAAPEA